MKNNYTEVEKIAQQGYNLEFGIVLEKAFNNYKKIALIGGVGMILVGIIAAIIFGSIFGIVYGFTDFTRTLTGLNPEFMDGSALIGLVLFSVLFAGLMSPINAGFINMANNAELNKNFGIETIFEYYKGSYFKELFISAAIIGFLGAGINYILEYAGIHILGTILTYVISYFTLLTIPLIIFSNLKAVEAISMSFKLVLKNPVIILGLALLAFIFMLLGIIGLCIGIFFTIPFWFSMIFTIYNEIIPNSETSELDEIGVSQE